jgi:hypothetical protein
MRKCTCDSGEWGDEQYDAEASTSRSLARLAMIAR